MPQSCLVPSCDSRKGDQNISFFRFPKDPAQREQWFQICGVKINQGPKDAKLCSLHFSTSDVRIIGKRKRCSLTTTALPKIFKKEEVLILSENPPPLVALHKPTVPGNSYASQNKNITNQIGTLRPSVLAKPYVVAKTPYHVLMAETAPALERRAMTAPPPLNPLKPGAIAAPQNDYHDHSESDSKENVMTREINPNVAFHMKSSIAQADGKIWKQELISKVVQTDTAACSCGSDALARENEELKKRNADLEMKNAYFARGVSRKRIMLESIVFRLLKRSRKEVNPRKIAQTS